MCVHLCSVFVCVIENKIKERRWNTPEIYHNELYSLFHLLCSTVRFNVDVWLYCACVCECVAHTGRKMEIDTLNWYKYKDIVTLTPFTALIVVHYAWHSSCDLNRYTQYTNVYANGIRRLFCVQYNLQTAYFLLHFFVATDCERTKNVL